MTHSASKRARFDWSRRVALRALAGLGSAALVSRFGLPRLARATPGPDPRRRFIFLYFAGGWDQLLFLDPRDQDKPGGPFDDANRDKTLTEPAYQSLEGYHGFSSKLIRAGNLTFGPATERPGDTGPKLSQFADRIAIVRGLNMGTLEHGVGYRYLLTGQPTQGSAARGTSIPVECAGQMKAVLPIPTLALDIESYNDRWPGNVSAVQISSLNDLLAMLDREPGLLERDAVEQALEQYAAGQAPCAVDVYDRHGLLTDMRRSQATAQGFFAQKLGDRFRFAQGNDETSQQIRAQYGLGQGDTSSPAARAAFAAQAIKQGVAQCISLSMGIYVDTHGSGNGSHADGLHPAIAALAALLDDLSKADAPPELQAAGGDKWIDHTTILAFSEFGRTPLFNYTSGRDHHLTNSCLLAGAGIVGNKVVGASGDVAMTPGRYDLAKRQVVTGDAGENLKPEHIAATLLASAGLESNIQGLRVEPLWDIVKAPA
ncbi:MAG: DUF1501 domain-containing protein [Myxococcales bacterium]|nr:MAG: DUF1501 domain-containing protein [Myxococcales bacterium]